MVTHARRVKAGASEAAGLQEAEVTPTTDDHVVEHWNPEQPAGGEWRARQPAPDAAGIASGDEVQVKADGVVIDGQPISRSVPLRRDSDGRPLPQRRGTHTMRIGEVFLLSTDDRRSFDGRYFGAVSTGAVRAVIWPVLTRHHSE